MKSEPGALLSYRYQFMFKCFDFCTFRGINKSIESIELSYHQFNFKLVLVLIIICESESERVIWNDIQQLLQLLFKIKLKKLTRKNEKINEYWSIMQIGQFFESQSIISFALVAYICYMRNIFRFFL